MAWQKTRIEIPPGFSKADRATIGNEIIEFIRDLALSGRGVHPDKNRKRKFPGYTEAYIKRKGQTNVDLELSGEMLEDLQVLSTKPDSILIGYKNNTESNGKAEGNQTGSYGRSPNPAKARPFIGITNVDLRRLIKEHIDDGS